MKLHENGAYLIQGKNVVIDSSEALKEVKGKTGKDIAKNEAKQNTIAYNILKTIIHLEIWKNFRSSLINLHHMILLSLVLSRLHVRPGWKNFQFHMYLQTVTTVFVQWEVL